MKFTFVAAAVLALTTSVGMAQTIHQRKENQQARIAQGVRSGQLTASETRHLEGREASINRQERHMRRVNGGRLTRANRATLNRRQNRASRAIYRDKHNAARRG